MAQTTLTTKIASLVAAFGVALGVVKVIDEATIDHEPVRVLHADDGRESGMAMSNPFASTNRPIYDADRISTTSHTNAWIAAAEKKEGNLDHITKPLPEISKENVKKAADLYKKFLHDKNDPSVEKSKIADYLKKISDILWDPRNMTLIGENPVQFLRDIRTYSEMASEETQMKIASGTIDPVAKLNLIIKFENYSYLALVQDDGYYAYAPDRIAEIEEEVSTGVTNIAHDVIRFAGQRLVTMGDPSTMTESEITGYLQCFAALEKIKHTDEIVDPTGLFSQYGLTPDIMEQLGNKKEDLLKRMDTLLIATEGKSYSMFTPS